MVLAPSSVAVLGASRQRGAAGGEPFHPLSGWPAAAKGYGAKVPPGRACPHRALEDQGPMAREAATGVGEHARRSRPRWRARGGKGWQP